MGEGPLCVLAVSGQAYVLGNKCCGTSSLAWFIPQPAAERPRISCGLVRDAGRGFGVLSLSRGIVQRRCKPDCSWRSERSGRPAQHVTITMAGRQAQDSHGLARHRHSDAVGAPFASSQAWDSSLAADCSVFQHRLTTQWTTKEDCHSGSHRRSLCGDAEKAAQSTLQQAWA